MRRPGVDMKRLALCRKAARPSMSARSLGMHIREQQVTTGLKDTRTFGCEGWKILQIAKHEGRQDDVLRTIGDRKRVRIASQQVYGGSKLRPRAAKHLRGGIC